MKTKTLIISALMAVTLSQSNLAVADTEACSQKQIDLCKSKVQHVLSQLDERCKKHSANATFNPTTNCQSVKGSTRCLVNCVIPLAY